MSRLAASLDGPPGAAVLDMLLGTDPQGYAGCAQAIADLDLDPLAPALGIADSRLRVIRGTSHLAPYQTPGPVTAAILGHLVG